MTTLRLPASRLGIVTLFGAPLAGLLLVWLAGFLWFVHLTSSMVEPPARADAIVALTGGAGRIETALKLLAEGRADRLLVSGVGGMAEFGGLARRAGVDPALGARVTLGRAAGTTRGNAIETAEWARANGLHSLMIVTAFYHMPRALAEFSRALRGAPLYPVPVFEGLHASPFGWLRLLLAEYLKWLAVRAGVADLAPHGDDRVAGRGETRGGV